MKAVSVRFGTVGRIGLMVAVVIGLLASFGPQPASAENTYLAGDRVKVIDGELNLREEAGLSADIIGVMADGTELEVLGGPSSASGMLWYWVETDEGTEGWAVEMFLAPALNGGGGDDFAQGDTVRVIGGALNFRESPGLDGTLRFVIDDGTAGAITDGPVVADGYTWYEIFNFGIGRGWVAGEFLVADDGISMCEGGGECENPQNEGDTVIVVTDFLNLRSQPGTNATVLDVLPNGAVGEYTGETEGANGIAWVKITGDFGTGWVARQFVAFD